MLKSISTWAFAPKRPAEEIFALAHNSGFRGIELSVGEDGFPLAFQVSAASSEADCARLRESADKNGLVLTSLASGLGWSYPLTSTDANLRQKALEAAKTQLQLAAWLDVDAILLVVGGVGADFIPGFQVTPYEVAYKNALAGLKELAPLAEKLGVTIGVENVWNKFLLSPLEFRAFLEEVNSPRVGAYFDVGNVVLTGYPADWIEILGARICRVHFKDFKRTIGTFDGFCALGEGDVNFPAVLAALKNANYSGPATAEFFDCEGDLNTISHAMDGILAG